MEFFLQSKGFRENVTKILKVKKIRNLTSITDLNFVFNLSKLRNPTLNEFDGESFRLLNETGVAFMGFKIGPDAKLRLLFEVLLSNNSANTQQQVNEVFNQRENLLL